MWLSAGPRDVFAPTGWRSRRALTAVTGETATYTKGGLLLPILTPIERPLSRGGKSSEVFGVPSPIYDISKLDLLERRWPFDRFPDRFSVTSRRGDRKEFVKSVSRIHQGKGRRVKASMQTFLSASCHVPGTII